jgi:putative transposase
VPRRLRKSDGLAVHHVFARGNNRDSIYFSPEDRWLYLAILGSVTRRWDWRCLAYCLMDNHLHLLLESDGAELASGMQWLHGRYANDFNQRNGHVGHVFQGRYGSKIVKNDEQLIHVAAYIARNPLEAGLVDDPAAWAWSSYAGAVNATAPDWLDLGRLLGYFAAWGGDGLDRYVEKVTTLTRRTFPLPALASTTTG